MENLNQPIKTPEGYERFVLALSEKLELIPYQVHPFLIEIGSDVLPFFRLIWSAEKLCPIISMHVETPNVDAIQMYCQARHMCPNILLSESYYTSFSGETFVGQDAYVACQMDRETQAMEVHSDGKVEDSPEEPATLIVTTPVYHAEDPKAAQQSIDLKKRKGYGRFM